MRLAFMGTPEFAVPSLDALVAAGHEVVAVYTQPPRPANRGKMLTPSAVQTRAEELGLSVRSPLSLRNAEAQAEFAELDLDAAIVAAYGLILPQAILDAPKFGCLNVHGSLLPRWRGAAPVQRAILAGDRTTGVMVMQMEAGLDTGPVRATTEIEIGRKTTGELTTELAELGAELMVVVLQDMAAHPAIPQSGEGVTYAAKIDKSETRIDFSQSAAAVERQVRAFNPAPGAWFEYEGERYRILEAQVIPAQPNVAGEVLDNHLTIACGTDSIRPTLIQRAGKPAMPTADLLRGKPIAPGTILA
ncbi:methionyl-tRNA formyltransferase [Sphingorhabdus contaminans]|jgi:methionyl-tRNA formyltransferase|uniref:Methionyl-tRNA formyltransferase n=1 Tax=Sphingorhabdus contaminans TaxID=1343899 RepID=A0A553WHF7_9SPHN|nr:methionyl-tRNA formyltransferase [Sphingorhabdus contaminans]TSB04074.1 methionyl-tRNA formyltransferase [Sphingorhabdus contaminans]